MLVKHKIAVIVTSILSLIAVTFLFKQNYLEEKQEIKFALKQKPLT